jgi:hypothetical protein
MLAGFVGSRLECAAKGRGDPRVRLRHVDADHLLARLHAIPIMLTLSVHAEQTTYWSAGFNRFGDRAEMTMK